MVIFGSDGLPPNSAALEVMRSQAAVLKADIRP